MFFQNLSFALLGMLLCLVGNVLHLLRTGDYGGWTIRSNSTNSLLRLMSWLLGMMSLGYIAYPEVILKNMVSTRRHDVSRLHRLPGGHPQEYGKHQKA